MHEKVYRYLEPIWADAMLSDGSIRIGSIESFTRLEDAQVDALDSAVQRNFSGFIPDAEKDHAATNTLLSMGIDIAGSIDVTVSGCRHIEVIYGHALCLSTVLNNSAFIKEGKSAIVEINDVLAFARALTVSARGALGDRFSLGPVRYEQREFDARGPSPRANPFVKRPQFSSEAEYRIFWPGHGSDPVTLREPSLIRFLKRVA